MPTFDPSELIRKAAAGELALSDEELRVLLAHVAAAGFDPTATETARSLIAGQRWQGKMIAARDRIQPEVRHYLLHVVVNEEWPIGTTQDGYIRSIRDVILDPSTGVFTNEYGGVPALGVIRESRVLRGPGGHDWILVQYRLERGHWMTAFQPIDGLDELGKPIWGAIRWLRAPEIVTELSSD